MHENAFLAYIYNCCYVSGSQFALYFKPAPCMRSTRLNVLPDFLKPGCVKVGSKGWHAGEEQGREGQGKGRGRGGQQHRPVHHAACTRHCPLHAAALAGGGGVLHRTASSARSKFERCNRSVLGIGCHGADAGWLP